MDANCQKPVFVQPGSGRKLIVLGQEMTLKLTQAETGGACYLFENVAPPGLGVPPHTHQHEDEMVWILEGEFEIFLDGKTFTATAGAAANFPRPIVHGFKNIGKTPGRALFLVSPGVNFEKFFEDLSTLPVDQPPDMAKVSEICGRFGIRILPQAEA